MAAPDYTDFAPIAALATPPGQSALAVIRVSGGGGRVSGGGGRVSGGGGRVSGGGGGAEAEAGALELLERCFSRPAALRGAAGHTAVYGWMMDGAEKVDEALITVYRAPKSYTGEDSADICCHGGEAAPRAVLRLLFRRGFRQALRGEFSYRAFINGKTGLSRAEAVMEVVCAKGGRALAGSVKRLSGVLEDEINAIKELLLIAVSETELHLDYSEVDGVGSADTALPARERILAARGRLEALLAVYQTGRLEKEGALVVLAGKPNAGKSSLFNLLLKEERSIVTEIPGTTRDWIEGWIEIDGIPVRLVDTAGVHESANAIERLGIERSLSLAASADITLTVLDGGLMNPALPPETPFTAAPAAAGAAAGAGTAGAGTADGGAAGAGAAAAGTADGGAADGGAADGGAAGAGAADGRAASPPPNIFVWNKCDVYPMPAGFGRAGGGAGAAGGWAGAAGAGTAAAGAGAAGAGAASPPPNIFVWNKCDVYPMPAGFGRAAGGAGAAGAGGREDSLCLEVSAKTGAGLAALCAAIAGTLRRQSAGGSRAAAAGTADGGAAGAESPCRGAEALYAYSGGVCPGTERQRSLIAAAKDALDEVLYMADKMAFAADNMAFAADNMAFTADNMAFTADNMAFTADAPVFTLDLIAPRLRDAVSALGEITGEVTTAAILDTMFSTFCVGK